MAGSRLRARPEPRLCSQVPTWSNLGSSPAERWVSWSSMTVLGCDPELSPLRAGALLPAGQVMDWCWGLMFCCAPSPPSPGMHRGTSWNPALRRQRVSAPSPRESFAVEGGGQRICGLCRGKLCSTKQERKLRGGSSLCQTPGDVN